MIIQQVSTNVNQKASAIFYISTLAQTAVALFFVETAVNAYYFSVAPHRKSSHITIIISDSFLITGTQPIHFNNS